MSSTKASPLKVSAVVFNAKGLKPKKKDKHKFSVIIGVGTHNKFRTDIVEDLFNNPVFNTECEISVDDPSQHLTFLVTEKHDKDILGQVTVPLTDLVTFRTNRPIRAALQIHKKCAHPAGELTYEAWISSGSLVASVLPVIEDIEMEGHQSSFPAGLKKLREKLSHSPMLSRKSSGGKGHKRTSSDGMFALKPNVSISCNDLSSLSAFGTSNPTRLSVSTAPDAESLSSIDSVTLQDSKESLKPEVTGISPKEGPAEGGTKLTIRGSNLGCNKEDVVGLYVCGSNVLSTLEYISSSKLMCTTKSHRPCGGTIAVETQSGGRGVSLVQFSFITTAASIEASDTASEASSTLSRSSSRGDADLKRDSALKAYGDHEADGASLSKVGLKARSMFDLSLPPMALRHVSSPPAARPEVTGVSPCDSPANTSTKITIRGSNLGKSRADIISVFVAGIDCTSAVDYESASRLVCLVGPTPNGAASDGDIIVETKSGGVGVSTVQFHFLDVSAGHEEEFAAVPYDSVDSSADVTAVLPSVQPNNGDVTRSSVSNASSRQPLVSTNNKQPPPVVEIQPMSRSDYGLPSSPRRKGPAPAVPAIMEINTSHTERGDADQLNQLQNFTKPPDNSLKDKIAELSGHLQATEEQVKRLQQENKLLKDENERMRQYMESLVSKAISSCPQILCIDSSKLT